MSQAAPITTGHGREALGNWMARGLGATGLCDSRGPPPTCTLPLPKGSSVSMAAFNEQSWAPKLADCLISEPGNVVMGKSDGSLHGPVISASLESTQGTLQQRAGSRSLPSELGDDASQQEFSELSDDEEDLRLTKVTKPTYKRGRKGKEKKKVGRPIAYRGDPNAPELTEQERRRIKRRIANRESARRVRHKRQEELEDMQIKMEQIQAQNSHLQQHATNVKDQKEMLNFQLHEVEQKYEKTCIENKQLAIEIQALRQSLQLKMSALEEELDKRATEAEGAVSHFAFSPAANFHSLSSQSQAQAVMMNPLPLEGGPASAPLDWLPSLDLDDFSHMDVVNHFLEEAPAS